MDFFFKKPGDFSLNRNIIESQKKISLQAISLLSVSVLINRGFEGASGLLCA